MQTEDYDTDVYLYLSERQYTFEPIINSNIIKTNPIFQLLSKSEICLISFMLTEEYNSNEYWNLSERQYTFDSDL